MNKQKNRKITDREKCTGCSVCTFVCPKHCIEMMSDKDGFLRPEIDSEICINCSLCEKICPANKQEENIESKPSAYAFQNENEKVRSVSSSGGAFTAMALPVIQNGGVVFGAAFDPDFRVKHICCETVEQLERLQGSKYVQSDISECFQAVKEKLECRREVLFSGTPCQIAAVKSVFGEKYSNLTTVDLVCHGVPSPLVWADYISEREKKSGSKAKTIQFRYKNPGWKKYSVKYNFDNGDEYIKTVSEDSYMRAFLGHVMLRESCYTCQFRGENRQSDITLADFWGVEKYIPEYDDNKGTSLIIVHSAKGKEIVKDLYNDGSITEVDFDSAISSNPSFYFSADKSPCRDAFQKALKKRGMDYAVKKYLDNSIVSKARRFFWKAVSKS